jgi:hypothetical protein
MKLMPQRLFADDELGCIRTIETINAIRARYSILHRRRGRLVVSIVEEAGFLQYFVSDTLQYAYDILSAPMDVRMRSWARVTNVFAARLMSKALYKIFLSSGRDWFRYVNAF